MAKINELVLATPKGLVLLSSWLVSQGYPYELLQRYRNGGWLKPIGKGAMVKASDPLKLAGALSALQLQLKTNIHVGGRSALELNGNTHYLHLDDSEIALFALGRTEIPHWLSNNQWDLNYRVFKQSIFVNDQLGMTAFIDGEVEMNISSPTRAMMECLALTPKEFSIHEAYELMEGLATLRPTQVQELMESCKSIKVKRLFLYFAERAGHAWFKYIDQSKINLGSGNRSLTPNGKLVPKYKLVLPKELTE